jgi:hypothetical protein
MVVLEGGSKPAHLKTEACGTRGGVGHYLEEGRVEPRAYTLNCLNGMTGSIRTTG